MGEGAGLVLVITCLINSFLIAGVGFGVPQILFILKDEKVYEYLCYNNSTAENPIEHDPGGDVCVEQEKKLVLIAQASLFALFFSRLLVGWALDHFGPRAITVIGALIVAMGSFIFAISSDSAIENDPTHGGATRTRRNWFACGMFMIAVGGTGLHLSNFHTASLFPRWRRTIFASISAVFTASVFVFFIFSKLHFSFHISYHTLFYSYSLLAIFISVVSHRIQQDKPLIPGDSVEFNLSKLRIQRVIDEIPILTELQASSYQHGQVLQKVEGEGEEKQNTTPTLEETESDRIHIKPETVDIVHLRLQDLPFSQQVRKPAFLLLTLCFASTLLSIQFFIVTFNDQMERKASSREESAFYINFMGTVSAMGFVMMPITVLVMDGSRWWQGYTSAWILQLVLVLLTNIINLSPISLTEEIVQLGSSSGDGSGSVSESHLGGSGLYLVYKPAVVYTLCWVWSVSRFFMFTIFFAFTAEQFGQKTFGRVTGTASLAASLVGLLVYPLADLTLETLDGNYDYVHVALAILVGSFLLWYPFFVKRTAQPHVT